MPSEEAPPNSPDEPGRPPPGRAQIEQLVKAYYEREAAADVDGLLQFVAPDVVFFPPTTWKYARFPFTLRGKDAVREAFLQRLVNYAFQPSIIHRVLIDGDAALAHRTRRIRERGGGQLHTFDCVDIFRFRDGLVVELVEFPDGAGRDAVVNYPL